MQEYAEHLGVIWVTKNSIWLKKMQGKKKMFKENENATVLIPLFFLGKRNAQIKQHTYSLPEEY